MCWRVISCLFESFLAFFGSKLQNGFQNAENSEKKGRSQIEAWNFSSAYWVYKEEACDGELFG